MEWMRVCGAYFSATGTTRKLVRFLTEQIAASLSPVSYTHLDVYKRQVLEHTAQKFGSLVLRQAGDIPAVNENLTGVHRPDACDGVECGGFSRAIAADDGYKIPVIQFQIDAVERILLILSLIHISIICAFCTNLCQCIFGEKAF